LAIRQPATLSNLILALQGTDSGAASERTISDAKLVLQLCRSTSGTPRSDGVLANFRVRQFKALFDAGTRSPDGVGAAFEDSLPLPTKVCHHSTLYAYQEIQACWRGCSKSCKQKTQRTTLGSAGGRYNTLLATQTYWHAPSFVTETVIQ
jgi:hypothetical protein